MKDVRDSVLEDQSGCGKPGYIFIFLKRLQRDERDIVMELSAHIDMTWLRHLVGLLAISMLASHVSHWETAL